MAYDAGLSPTEVRDASFGELQAVAESWMRRERRAHEARAWVVAHLMWVSGNLARGTQVGALMRMLLGRAEAEPTPAATAELSPEASVAYMRAWTKRLEKP